MRILITFKLLIVDIQNTQNITTECFRQKLCFPEQMTAQTTLFKDKLIKLSFPQCIQLYILIFYMRTKTKLEICVSKPFLAYFHDHYRY